jgi:metallo-beta-lactamase family protein
VPVQLRFHGAASAVTGSCFALFTENARVLVDCGMFQGPKSEKELNYRTFPFTPADLDAVLLTHAHIDHSGLLPKLVKAGFTGPIHATRATLDLCSVMLPDSGFIQQMEVEQLNRRNLRRGLPEVSPIYTAEDAAAALTQFRPAPFGSWITVAPGIRARYWNAGHLLGSASIEVEAQDGSSCTRILFSGDIGPHHKALQFDPEAPSGFDYVVCEATYGDTDRPRTSHAARRKQLAREVADAAKRRGVLLIPSFAVERTQELLVDLVALMDVGMLPTTPIFIDSPLASRASEIFRAHAGEIEEGGALVRALDAHNVRFTESVEQSKAIDRIRSFHIIIAASGMCEAGRMRHHLKAWLWRDEATVLFVGFQAQGTLGRILQDGAARVRIMGEEVRVRARIRTLEAYSGHADGRELEGWLRARLPIGRNLFLVHGEEAALAGLKRRASAFHDPERIVIPTLDEGYALTSDGARPVGKPRRIEPSHVGHPDWHNELSRLILDLGTAVRGAPDDASKRDLLGKLRKQLDAAE